MAAEASWENLPSVIIVEILSRLSVTDKFQATGTCKKWRQCLFHASLWRKYDFKFKYGSRKVARFLTKAIGRFVKEASIEFNSRFYADVRDCLVVLEELVKNGNLEKIVLKPFSFQITWPDESYRNPADSNMSTLFVAAIEDIITHSKKLKHISLGCIPELTENTDSILQLLEYHQIHNVENLHIASVKEDPDNYEPLNIPEQIFSSLTHLHTISIDYDYITSNLLAQLVDVKRHVPLEKLILHVHRLDHGREKISNLLWERVVKANPNLEVTLTLVHSIDGCANISDIIRPAMPVVHFRMLFCGDLNVTGINMLTKHMSATLESVYIVDGLDFNTPMAMEYSVIADEDPFVMMAWKCSKLQHFTLYGYNIAAENVIAMARLRGSQLKTLNIPSACISLNDDEDFEEDFDVAISYAQLLAEVSGSLGRQWEPVPDEELPLAVLDSKADAESAYLNLLLADQD